MLHSHLVPYTPLSTVARHAALALGIVALTACGGEDDVVGALQDAVADAGITTPSTGGSAPTTSTPAAGDGGVGGSVSDSGLPWTSSNEGGTSSGTTSGSGLTGGSGTTDGGGATSTGDAGAEEDPFAGLFGEDGAFGVEQPTEMTPPPDATPGGWTLNPDSAAECPAEPPPTPIDPCLGVYWACSWQHADGQQYTCVCDWIHYLCI